MSPGRPGLPPRIELSWAIAYSTPIKDRLAGRHSASEVSLARAWYPNEVLLFGVGSAFRGIPGLAGRDAGRSDISRTPLHSLRPEGLLLPPEASLAPGPDFYSQVGFVVCKGLFCRVVVFI
jgi:hypothetical protein